MRKGLGHRVSLDSVAKATLNVSKSGSGLDAIRYYREALKTEPDSADTRYNLGIALEMKAEMEGGD